MRPGAASPARRLRNRAVMRDWRASLACAGREAGAGLAVALAVVACAQQLPFEPSHDAGQSITGAFEGWFANTDGSFSILIGYYNRNLKQKFDIPTGPNNRIEPGGPDF